MSKVIIRNINTSQEFTMGSLLMEYTREGKLLFITEKPELAQELNNLNKDKLVVLLASNINRSGICELKRANPDVKNVIFHTARIIDRYYNEALNVKRNKVKDYFDFWDVKVTILSKNEGANAVMSNNDNLNGKTHQQVQKQLYGPRAGKGKRK